MRVDLRGLFKRFKQQQQCLQHPKRINFRQVTVNSCQEGKIPSHAKIEKTRHSWWPKTHSTFSNLPEFLTDSEKLLFCVVHNYEITFDHARLTSEIFSVLFTLIKGKLSSLCTRFVCMRENDIF